MDHELISKKDLLELAGISYGQLYRWKRKNLIPEEWFIRKSTFTGQETFFPKEKIMARIDKIVNMKEDLSLDDLADMFSPNPADLVLTLEELMKRNIVTNPSLELFLNESGYLGDMDFEKVLTVYILDTLLQTGEISLEEGKSLIQVMNDNYKKFEGRNCELVLLRKFGLSTCFLASAPVDLFLEKGAKIVTRLNMASCIEELKIRLN